MPDDRLVLGGNALNGSHDAVRRLEAARATGSWKAVLGVLAEDWSTLYQLHPSELLETLEEMPEDVLEREPRLRLGMQHIRRNLRGERETHAYQDILTIPDDAAPIDRLAAMTGQIAVARRLGRQSDATAVADEAVAYLRTLPVETVPSLRNALPEFHYQWGVTFAHVGRFADALRQFTASFDWSRSVEHRMMMKAAGGAAALIHALHGRGREVESLLRELPSARKDEWWSHFAPTPGLLAEAWLHIDRLDHETAAHIISQIDITHSLDYWAPYYVIRTYIAIARGEGLQSLLTEFDSFVESSPHGYLDRQGNAETIGLIRYLLLLHLQQPGRAARELEHEPPATRASVIRQLGAMMLARRFVGLERRNEARRLVAPLLNVAGSRPRILIRALLIAAETDVLGREDEFLRRAVELAEWHSHYSGFVFSAQRIRQRVADLLDSFGNATMADRIRSRPERPPVPGRDALTRRESAVVELALSGLANTQIAEQLHVSRNTVKSQLRSAYSKLAVSNRAQLAQRLGIDG